MADSREPEKEAGGMSAAATTIEQATTANALDDELAEFARRVAFHKGPWTEEEFFELPTFGNRIELVNGGLLMSPKADSDHQWMMVMLTNLLFGGVPAGWKVVPDVDLRLKPGLIREPDVLVATHKKRTKCYEVADVVLVAEIESPSSRGTDRAQKPYEYAVAGIEWYLRVKRNGPNAPTAFVYHLQGKRYVEYARAHAGQVLELTEPVKVSFDPAVLVDDE